MNSKKVENQVSEWKIQKKVNGFFEKNCSESINDRTSKIFYVCCTRVKENLAVYFQNPSAIAISTAKEWFGENNVVEVTP